MVAISEIKAVDAHTNPNTASAATLTVSAAVTTVSALVKISNPNRVGLYIYNNSANTVYINFGATANSNTNMVLPIATFATWVMPIPIYYGQISAIRNTGTGTLLITELTP